MRAFIVLLDNFPGVSRLPGALCASGFEVGAICHPSAYLAQTRCLVRHFRWPQLQHRSRILGALAAAITAFAPDLIIPGDQRSVTLLQDLASGKITHRHITASIITTIRTSLGDPAGYEERLNKGATCRAALELGLAVPEASPVSRVEDALRFADDFGYPMVLKRDLGAAADGVRVCQDEPATRRHFSELMSARRPESALRRLARTLRGNYLNDCHLGSDNSINAVRFVPGPVAMRAVATWRGEVVAGLSAVKEVVHPSPLGPSTIVRFVDNPEMEATVSALVKRWGSSGFLSFDFIISSQDGHAYLLECNPRPVPICHFGDFSGSNLCASLASAMTGGPKSIPAQPTVERVALFPQEWRRDPVSHWLKDAYHDVPWDDPKLLRALCTGT